VPFLETNVTVECKTCYREPSARANGPIVAGLGGGRVGQLRGTIVSNTPPRRECTHTHLPRRGPRVPQRGPCAAENSPEPPPLDPSAPAAPTPPSTATARSRPHPRWTPARGLRDSVAAMSSLDVLTKDAPTAVFIEDVASFMKGEAQPSRDPPPVPKWHRPHCARGSRDGRAWTARGLFLLSFDVMTSSWRESVDI